MKYCTLVAVAAASVSAFAAETTWNHAYPELMEALALAGNVENGERAFVVCQGCHRPMGLGRADGSYPRLAGQHANVIIKQVIDVQNGRRANIKMQPFADHANLSAQDVADIANYLQGIQAPSGQGVGPGTALALGRSMYATGCSTCHGQEGEGNAQKFYPRLAGQHYRYLLREVRMIRDGDRLNAHPDMVLAIRQFGDEELAAVSDYVSRISAASPPPDANTP